MTRLEVLSHGRIADSAEVAKLHRGVRQHDRDMRRFRGIARRMEADGCGSAHNNPAKELGDGQVERDVANIFAKFLYPEEKREFTRKTELILKAACAQYLGYYPTQTPSKSEIKTILGEMARMHGRSWENGFECMEPWFPGTQNAIREIRRYAKENGILPVSR